MNEVIFPAPESAKKPLRALLVEDSEFDADLTVRYLKLSYNVEWRQAQDAAGMEDALKYDLWDVVLCDYWMRGFGVVSALELLKARALDLPFIVVSGTMGEALAVETMRAGAHDYIMKHDLARLAPAIEREMGQARNRRERARTLRKAAWLAAVVDSMGDAVVGTDREGRVTSWNAAAERLYGFTAEEVLGGPMDVIVPPALRGEAVQILNKVLGGGPLERFETIRSRKNGTAVDAACAISGVKDENGRVMGAALVARDITERKRAQEERQTMIQELRETAGQVRRLQGLLPICASCKRIRDEKGNWQRLETYISGHSEAEFSHSVCPGCARALYPEYLGNIRK